MAVGGRRAGPARPPAPRRALQPRRGTARARRVPRSAERARRAHRRVSARRTALRATHAGGVPRGAPGRGPPGVPAAPPQPRRRARTRARTGARGARASDARPRPGARAPVPPARSGTDALEPPAVPLEIVTDHGDALRNLRASQLQLGLATVAVLITDLVGSASMRTRLGDHRADEMERWHETIVNKAVADYQGTIVKRLGDGAMAIFTTATDAIAAAAAIQTRLAREARAQAAAMHVRIGISAGEVVLEENDVRGLPPTEAARLCARAEGGQILTTGLVQHLATARSAAQFRPVGAFDLKGLPGPTPLYEVPWPISGDDTVPFPDTLDPAAYEFAFVGPHAGDRPARRGLAKRAYDEHVVVGLGDWRSRSGEVASRHRVRPFDRPGRAHGVVRALRRSRRVSVPTGRRVAAALPRARVAGERRHGAGAARRAVVAPRSRARRRVLGLRPRPARRRRRRPVRAVRSGGRVVDARLGRWPGAARARRPPMGVAAHARDAAARRRHRAAVPGDVARDVPRRRRSGAPAGRSARTLRRGRPGAAGRVGRARTGGRRGDGDRVAGRDPRRRAHRRAGQGDPRGVERESAVRHVTRAPARVGRSRAAAAAAPPRTSARAGDGAGRQPALRARPGHGRAAAEGRGRGTRNSSSRCCACSRPTATTPRSGCSTASPRRSKPGISWSCRARRCATASRTASCATRSSRPFP